MSHMTSRVSEQDRTDFALTQVKQLNFSTHEKRFLKSVHLTRSLDSNYSIQNSVIARVNTVFQNRIITL
jgi:hypothetical protein